MTLATDALEQSIRDDADTLIADGVDPREIVKLLRDLASEIDSWEPPEPNPNAGGDSPSYRAAMRDAGRGHLLR